MSSRVSLVTTCWSSSAYPNSMTPNDSTITPKESTKLDYEVELAVVIGRTVRRADEAQAVGRRVALDVDDGGAVVDARGKQSDVPTMKLIATAGSPRTPSSGVVCRAVTVSGSPWSTKRSPAQKNSPVKAGKSK